MHNDPLSHLYDSRNFSGFRSRYSGLRAMSDCLLASTSEMRPSHPINKIEALFVSFYQRRREEEEHEASHRQIENGEE
jgi:hypothetical protein